MADESKDIELRIRARDYSQKTLDDVVKTLKDLMAAQEEQLEAAKRGEVSARELEASYRKLENAAKALASQHALTKQFEAQSRALDESTQKLEAARKAQQEYARSLQGVDKVTRKQESELRKLSNAVVRAERAHERAADRVAKTTNRLNEYGISTDNLAASQQRIVSAVQTANIALERQDAAIGRVDQDIRRARQAAEEKARADREMAKAAEQAAREAAEQARQQRLAAEEAERQAKAQAEMRAALNKAADEAEAASKGYRTLATTLDEIPTAKLTQSLREIADPTGEAIKNIDGLEQAVGDLEGRIKSIDGPIKDYRQTLQQLQAVQKSLSDMGTLIESYNRQERAVARARAEYEKAEREVKALVEQMRSGTGPVNEMNRKMRDAQARLREAANAMRQQSQSAAELRTRLNAAGISTDNMSKAEERLISSAKRARQAVLDLNAAYDKYGAAVERSRKTTLRFWRDEGRTTLSWMQRIRGELLAIATAYAGVQAAINLAGGALDAYRTKQAALARLLVMFQGDQKAANAEWEYLIVQADRLKFNIQTLAADYTKFGVAAMAMGLSLQETRFIFERVAEASRAANMSSEDFQGVMKALEQMISKGTIQMEELRQQLGDRLPGAFALAARGAGMAIDEFAKAIELGNISADYVINLAREMEAQYGEGLEAALGNMQASEAALQNAIYHFKLALAEGGFVDAYTDFIERLTDLLQSEQGERLAQQLSDAFSAIADALAWCADNVELLKAAFALFIGLQVGKYLASLAPLVLELSRALGGLLKVTRTATGVARNLRSAWTGVSGTFSGASKGATTAARAMRLLGLAARFALRFVPLLGTALTAWEIYSWLKGDDAEAEGKEAGERIGEKIAEGIEEGLRTTDPGTGGTASERVRRAIMRSLEQADAATAKLDLSTRTRAARSDLEERLKIASEEFEALKKQAEAHITEEEKLAKTLVAIEEAKNRRLAVERKRFELEQKNADANEAERRRRLAEDIARDLERIESDLQKRLIERDPTATFEQRAKSRVDAVAHEYNRLLKKIDQLEAFDKAGAEESRQRVQDYIKLRQEAENMAVTQEEANRLERDMNAQLSLRQARTAALQAEYEAGLITMAEYQQGLLDINDAMSQGILEATEALEEFARTYADIIGEDVAGQLVARAQTVRAANQPDQVQASTQLANAEARVNYLLTERQAVINELNLQYQRGLITEKEMVDGINAAHQSMRAELADTTEQVIRLATELRNPANAAAMDALILKMKELGYEAEQSAISVSTAYQVGVESALNNSVEAFDSMAQSIAKVISGQQDVKDMFAEMGRASAQFFADFLRDIAIAIIRQQILNAMRNSGNPYISAAAMAMQAHGGGVVGRGGNHTRRVDASWFAGAKYYHTGGLPGLQPDEVPAIVQKGEEILARDDPRNILNGGGGGGETANRFVLVDDRSRVAEAMAGAEGERVTMIHLRKNIPTLKQMLG